MNIRYEYIDYKNTLFKEVIDLRYDMLFKPYDKIEKYEYDNLDHKSFHLVGIVNNTVISYSRLTPIDENSKIAKISNVVVSEDYNNMGIGLEMLKKHISTAKLKDFTQLFLHARKDTIGFYKKAGFNPKGPLFISDRSGLYLQKMFLNI